jgi:hypothetical protein
MGFGSFDSRLDFYSVVRPVSNHRRNGLVPLQTNPYFDSADILNERNICRKSELSRYIIEPPEKVKSVVKEVSKEDEELVKSRLPGRSIWVSLSHEPLTVNNESYNTNLICDLGAIFIRRCQFYSFRKFHSKHNSAILVLCSVSSVKMQLLKYSG